MNLLFLFYLTTFQNIHIKLFILNSIFKKEIINFLNCFFLCTYCNYHLLSTFISRNAKKEKKIEIHNNNTYIYLHKYCRKNAFWG